MSHGGFPEHAMGDKLNGAQVTEESAKQFCQYVPTKNDLSDDFYRADELNDEVRKADDPFRRDKPVVCYLRASSCSDSERRQQRPSSATSVSWLALVMCLAVYLIHVDLKYSTQVAELRREVKQLAHLCRSSEPLNSHTGGEGFVHSADGFVEELPGESELPLASADVSSDDRRGLGVGGVPSVWHQAGQPQVNGDHNVAYDDDEDDDLDDTSVGDSSDDNEGDDKARQPTAGGEERLHRIRRRAAETPKKKRKGGSCKRFKRCKKAQDKGRQLNAKCQNMMDCLDKADKGASLDRNCRRVMSCVKTEEPMKTPEVAPSPFVPKPVHFFSDFWNERRQQEFGREACIYVQAWQGTACRNRTVTLRQPYTPLKFLQSADWMKTFYKSRSEQPIQEGNDGGFLVKQSGLYLIYSSVMFHDLKPRHSQAVVVNGQKLFKCMDSVDYVDPDLPAGNNQAKYKTCAMTGVTHLSEGDRLEVHNLYDNTEIDLSTDATYFGAVLFTPGQVKAPNP